MTGQQHEDRRTTTRLFIEANKETMTVPGMAKALNLQYQYVHDVARRSKITVKEEEQRKLPESEAAPGCFCTKQYFFNNATY